MANYDLQTITDNLIRKTNSHAIIWTTYNYCNDTNVYSHRYFNSLPFLNNEDGFVSNYEHGFIYLIRTHLKTTGLFLQPNDNDIPTCLNYNFGSIESNSCVENLYSKVSLLFDDLNSFITKINS